MLWQWRRKTSCCKKNHTMIHRGLAGPAQTWKLKKAKAAWSTRRMTSSHLMSKLRLDRTGIGNRKSGVWRPTAGGSGHKRTTTRSSVGCD